MRIAIIGSGAAAMGALIACHQQEKFPKSLSMFDIGKPNVLDKFGDVSRDHDPHRSQNELASIYRQLRRDNGLSFPPPKSTFGVMPSKIKFQNKQYLWKSEHFGGLTNFWGGGMLPFTDNEFADWPISAVDLQPWYERVAENVGIAGVNDGLNSYFGDGFVNRPAIRLSEPIQKLNWRINEFEDAKAHYDWIAGTTHLALETRDSRINRCTYTGLCMTGCPQNSIFSTREYIQDQVQAGYVKQYIRGKVLKIDADMIFVEHNYGVESYGKFDRIFIAAGCIGSTEIVMRSLGISTGPVMRDSRVASFPILMAHQGSRKVSESFALSNLTVGCRDKEDLTKFIQGSIYPFQDHFWRYLVPPVLWPIAKRIAKLGHQRVLFARFVLPTEFDRTYEFEMRDEQLKINPISGQNPAEVIKQIRSDLHLLFKEQRFARMPLGAVSQGTSSHYSSTFPYGGNGVEVGIQGKIKKGTFLIDSSVFPTAPSISPTFTIIANAARMTDLALNS